MASKAKLLAVLVIAGVLVPVACSSPTAESPSEGGGDSTATDSDEVKAEVEQQLADALAELEGLEGDERRQRLLEMAQAEEEAASRPFTSYTSLTLEDLEVVYGAFEDFSDIDVDIYRAQPSEVATRLQQEAEAGYRGADLIELNSLEMATLSNEGALAAVDTPITDEVLDGTYTKDWVSRYLLLIVAGWNTNAITGDDIPTTWEEVLTEYPGRLGWEPTLIGWFITLVNDYFIKEKGMSEEEAIQMFADAAEAGVTQTASLVQTAELLGAGEFDVAATLFNHQLERVQRDGAPVAWNDPAPVEPIVVRSQGTGIYAYAQRPITALLWLEWMLTDGQVLMVDRGRIPIREDVEVPGGLPYAGYDIIHERLDIMSDPAQLGPWEEKWEAIVQP